jgi:sarcosine oxidase
MTVYDAIVVGLGSMGSAAIYNLARRGVRVLGLEQFDVPNSLGSSVGVNRIIRLAYAEHPDYVPLLQHAYDLWRELEKRVGEQLLIITGGVDIGIQQSATVTGSLRACKQHNLQHQILDAGSMARRFPGYRLPSNLVAVYQPQGGFLMSERCVAAYVGAALDSGAEVHGRERVVSWAVRSGRVRVTSEDREYESRSLVICAGPWTARLLPDFVRLAVPQRQVLIWTQPRRPELFRPERFPVFNMEAAEGRFYGFPIYGIPGFKIGKSPPRRS